MEQETLANIVEVVLLSSSQPVSVDTLAGLFSNDETVPERSEIRDALAVVAARCEQRGVELVEVASGHRFQVRQEYGHWVAQLALERPGRYSRALLETLALIAYRQPITRGEIEDVRGVSVSSSIIKTLHERDWIRVVGHRELPGRPALYGTSRQFLDDFGLRRLEDLPPLSEIRDLSEIGADLFSDANDIDAADAESDQAEASGDGANADESDDEVSSGLVPLLVAVEQSEATAGSDAPAQELESNDGATDNEPHGAQRAADEDGDDVADEGTQHDAAERSESGDSGGVLDVEVSNHTPDELDSAADADRADEVGDNDFDNVVSITKPLPAEGDQLSEEPPESYEEGASVQSSETSDGDAPEPSSTIADGHDEHAERTEATGREEIATDEDAQERSDGGTQGTS